MGFSARNSIPTQANYVILVLTRRASGSLRSILHRQFTRPLATCTGLHILQPEE